MKNKLFFIIFISSFLFLLNVNSASAKTVQAYYDSDYVNNQILGNTDLDYLNNQLIPFVNNNMQDYYVYIGLNNGNNANYTTGYIFILDKNNYNYSGVRMYNRSGYTNYLRISRYNTIDSNFNISDVGSGYMQFTYRADTNLSITSGYDNGLDIIQALQNWLISPSYNYPTNYDSNISPLVYQTGGNLNFLDEVRTPSERLPYYINDNSLLVTSTDYNSYQGNYVVHYNDQELVYSLGDEFPTYYDIVIGSVYIPPVFTSFGDGQYGFTANSIKISDINTDILSVNCPKDTSFINDFCYTTFANYPTDDDLLNAQLIVDFDLLNNVPYTTGNYYILTIRFDSPTLYLPTSASISSGNVSIPISIVKTNVINSGIYKDLQIVLHTDQQLSSSDVYLSSIALLFPTLSSYNPDLLSWQYGLFKTYKFSDVGNTLPDDKVLSDNYSTNTLDGIKKSDKSWFDKFNVNDRGLSSFITSPIRLFQSMRTSTCTDIELPLPHFGNIKLPCISSIFSSKIPELFNIYQVIMSGIICYYIGLNYFRIIKNAFNPEDDRIEVQDL